MCGTGTIQLYSWSGTYWKAILFEKQSCAKSPLLRYEVLWVSNGNMYGILSPLYAQYIDRNAPIKLWGIRDSLWEHFDAYRIFVRPPLAEISDKEIDVVGPKLTIHS